MQHHQLSMLCNATPPVGLFFFLSKVETDKILKPSEGYLTKYGPGLVLPSQYQNFYQNKILKPSADYVTEYDPGLVSISRYQNFKHNKY